MHRFLLALLASLPLGLAGCPTSPADDDDSSVTDDDDVADDDDTSPSLACDDDDATPEADCSQDPCAATADGGVVRGFITDEAGDGLRCINLTVCSSLTCLFGKTDETGAWCVQGLAADDYVVHNIDHPGENPAVNMRNWASFYDFVQPAPNTDITVDSAQVVPFMPESVREPGPWSGPTTLTWNDLSVSFDGDLLQFPFPAATCPDQITLSAVEVPPANWPLHGLMGWEIIGAWVFAPFETLQEDANGDPVAFDVSVPVGDQDPTMDYGLLFADYELNIGTGTFSEGTAALVGQRIEGSVERLSLVLAVRR